jgi:translation initiation factor IF-2
VEIKQYSVIYEAIDDVTLLLEGMLTPIIEENVLGHAEVRQIFTVPKLGTICGCSVLDGVLQRSAKMRLFRGKEMLWEGEVASLKRFKDDVKEVAQGYECGVGLQGYSKANVGDRLECYELKKIPRKLKPEGTSSQRQSASA